MTDMLLARCIGYFFLADDLGVIFRGEAGGERIGAEELARNFCGEIATGRVALGSRSHMSRSLVRITLLRSSLGECITETVSKLRRTAFFRA